MPPFVNAGFETPQGTFILDSVENLDIELTREGKDRLMAIRRNTRGGDQPIGVTAGTLVASITITHLPLEGDNSEPSRTKPKWLEYIARNEEIDFFAEYGDGVKITCQTCTLDKVSRKHATNGKTTDEVSVMPTTVTVSRVFGI